MNNEDFNKLMSRAENTVLRMDASDRKYGFAAPTDSDIVPHINTVISTLECGIKTEDPNTIAEGIVMLKQAAIRLERDNLTQAHYARR